MGESIMALLKDMTKEQLERLCQEQAADIGILINTKAKLLQNNEDLATQVVTLQKENFDLVMLCRRNGLL